MSNRVASSFAFMLATSVLAPLGAQALPATAIAKAEARYELLLAGGTVTGNVPSTDYETTVISIGDVVGASLATTSLTCPVPGSSCLFGGQGIANVLVTNGHMRVEAGVGPFSVDFAMASSGTLILSALVEDEFSLSNAGAPGGEASALVDIGDFTLTPLGGVPVEFGVDPGAPASIPLAVGLYSLTWSGLDVAAEARLTDEAVPAPASLALLGAALSALAASRRVRALGSRSAAPGLA